MKLAIDFDSTVWPLLPAMGISYEEVHYWGHLPDMLGGIDQMHQAFTRVMPFREAVEHPPFPGCVDTLRSLKDQGVEIHLITHRETCYRSDVEDYVNHYSIPVDYLDCSPELDKVKICAQRGVGVLIDDHPEIAIEAAQSGISAYMLLFKYNQHAREYGVMGFEDWSQMSEPLRQSLCLKQN